MLDDYPAWLVATAQDVGLASGDAVTSYGEIVAWSTLSGVALTLWEVESVRHLSGTYLSGLQSLTGEHVMQPHLSAEGKRAWALAQEARADRALSTSAEGTAARTKGRARR